MLNELLKAHLNNLACTNYSQAFCVLRQCTLQSARGYKYFGLLGFGGWARLSKPYRLNNRFF